MIFWPSKILYIYYEISSYDLNLNHVFILYLNAEIALRDYKIFDIYSLHTLNDATNPCMNFDHANTVHDFFDHTNLSTFFASQVYLIYEKISDLLPLQRYNHD